MNFKNLKFTSILSISQPAIRPGCISAMTLEFLHIVALDLQNCFSKQHLLTAP